MDLRSNEIVPSLGHDWVNIVSIRLWLSLIDSICVKTQQWPFKFFSVGLYTNVNSLLFWVHFSSQKISEKETALNCGFRFAIANTIKAANLKQFL